MLLEYSVLEEPKVESIFTHGVLNLCGRLHRGRWGSRASRNLGWNGIAAVWRPPLWNAALGRSFELEAFGIEEHRPALIDGISKVAEERVGLAKFLSHPHSGQAAI